MFDLDKLDQLNDALKAEAEARSNLIKSMMHALDQASKLLKEAP